MFDNPLVRFLSVVVVIGGVWFVWYRVKYARQLKKGLDETAAKKQASLGARKASLVVAYFYMVFMVSVAGLFL